MGKVALTSSKVSFDLLQNTIDYLTCKAKGELAFTNDEKEFMKELFEAFWWGGNGKGYYEAATLANHYVNGEGNKLKINSTAYRTSVIVKDTMIAMKEYIKYSANNELQIRGLKSSDKSFYKSTFATHLWKGKRSVLSKGYIFNNGVLVAEQANKRLHETDNRFYLNVTTSRGNDNFISNWKVESIYDFESFKKGYITDIPLAQGMTLKLPDGLSFYLTKIGVAKPYIYTARWTELWR